MEGNTEVKNQMKKGPWIPSEDAKLKDYVRMYGEGNWNTVQKKCGLERSGKSCRLRWADHLRPNLKKGPFSIEEEQIIIHHHSKLGNRWAQIAKMLPGRTNNEIKSFWKARMKKSGRSSSKFNVEMSRSSSYDSFPLIQYSNVNEGSPSLSLAPSSKATASSYNGGVYGLNGTSSFTDNNVFFELEPLSSERRNNGLLDTVVEEGRILSRKNKPQVEEKDTVLMEFSMNNGANTNNKSKSVSSKSTQIATGEKPVLGMNSVDDDFFYGLLDNFFSEMPKCDW